MTDDLATPTKRGRVLIFVADRTGHVNPALGLAQRLLSYHTDVVFIGPPAAAPLILTQGFSFRPASQLASLELPIGESLRRALSPLRFAQSPLQFFATLRAVRRDFQRFVDCFAEIGDALTALIRELRPVLMVFDPFLLLYAIPLHRAGVPIVALSTKPLLDHDPLIPPYTCALGPGVNPLARWRIGAAWRALALQRRLWGLCERLIAGYSVYDLARAVGTQCGFPIEAEWKSRPVWFDLKFRSIPEIILHARELDLPRRLGVGDGTIHVGPCVHHRRREPPFDWSRVTLGDKLVVCALGSMFHPRDLPRRARFLRNLARAMAARPRLALIMAVGPGLDPEDFRGLSANTYVYRHIPQLAVLRRADLFITHGGSNSVKEAISLGVPLVVYPERAEQPGLTVRVVHHGLGRAGDPVRARTRDILKDIDAVLENDLYRRNVAEMREVFEQYDRTWSERSLIPDGLTN
jgi:zeaxanthin glucosyltransferase